VPRRPANNAGNATTVFVFDPTTGRCWSRSANTDVRIWNDLGTPVIKPNN
jgi:hypothetical protein